MLLASRAVSNDLAADSRSLFSGGPAKGMAPARTWLHAASTGVHADSTGVHAEEHGVQACDGDGIDVTVMASPAATLGRHSMGPVLLLRLCVLSEAGRRLEGTEAPWVEADEESISEGEEQKAGSEKAVVFVGGRGTAVRVAVTCVPARVEAAESRRRRRED